jgi:hypothetical protein
MPRFRFPRTSVVGFLCLTMIGAAAAQGDPCAELQKLKTGAYGFRPSKLAEPQQAEKSKQMDRFWNLAQSQGERGVSCLRTMLKSEKDDAFFLFDGAALLFHLDQSPASVIAVLDALSRSDLGEINPAGYVALALELAQQGVDTGGLAEKYLKYPKVDSFVPEHSMPLDRLTGATFLYGSMPAERADKYLIPLLSSNDAQVHAASALQLAFNMTRESYRAISELQGIDDLPQQVKKQVVAAMAYHAPADKSIPTYSRQQVLARLRALPRTPEQVEAELKKSKPVVGIADDEPFLRSASAVLTSADLDVVREARRASLMAVSDECLYEYAAYTRIILGVINRLDLYREFRVH